MKLHEATSHLGRTTLVAALTIAGACAGSSSADEPKPAASIRIETKTPSTLADSDMVVMRASVFDFSGTVLPGAAVTWTSVTPKTVSVSADGHLYGHVATSNFCCEGASSLWGRDAKIIASVSSNPLIADTTLAYVMLYATIVALKPNTVEAKAFSQVATLAAGETSSLHATGYVQTQGFRGAVAYDSLSVDQLMQWTSRSPEIASIDRNGVVTGRSTGKATIVVEARGGKARDSAYVVVR